MKQLTQYSDIVCMYVYIFGLLYGAIGTRGVQEIINGP